MGKDTAKRPARDFNTSTRALGTFEATDQILIRFAQIGHRVLLISIVCFLIVGWFLTKLTISTSVTCEVGASSLVEPHNPGDLMATEHLTCSKFKGIILREEFGENAISAGYGADGVKVGIPNSRHDDANRRRLVLLGNINKEPARLIHIGQPARIQSTNPILGDFVVTGIIECSVQPGALVIFTGKFSNSNLPSIQKTNVFGDQEISIVTGRKSLFSVLKSQLFSE